MAGSEQLRLQPHFQETATITLDAGIAKAWHQQIEDIGLGQVDGKSTSGKQHVIEQSSPRPWTTHHENRGSAPGGLRGIAHCTIFTLCFVTLITNIVSFIFRGSA